MRKTDRKIDNQLTECLTEVCDKALQQYAGFQWLTHLVNYSFFPSSLKVVCVFDTIDNLNRFIAGGNKQQLNAAIEQELLGIGIKVKSIENHISYDTEESCAAVGSGSYKENWAARLAKL